MKGLPTACGAKRWAGRIAETDAEVVATLREAGAVIMGKTVTTPYAWIDPPTTRNPWNLERTPGRLIERFGRGGRLRHVLRGDRHPDRRIDHAAGVVLRRRRHEADHRIFVSSAAGCLPSPPAWTMSARSLARRRPPNALRSHLRRFANRAQARRSRVPLRYDGPPRLARLRGFFDRAGRAGRSLHARRSARGDSRRGAEIVDLDDPVDFEQVLKDHRTMMAAEAAANSFRLARRVPR